jgi:hypothetical protein
MRESTAAESCQKRSDPEKWGFVWMPDSAYPKILGVEICPDGQIGASRVWMVGSGLKGYSKISMKIIFRER